MPLESYFEQIGLRRSILLCQLPLSAAILLIFALTALFSPATLHDQLFLLILLVHGLIFVVCLLAPWNRLPAGSFAVIPILDCLAVGLSREAGGPVLSVVGLLMVLPVAWLAVSTSKSRVLLAMAAALSGTLVPPLVLGYIPKASDLVRVVVFPTIMGVVAVTAHLVARAVKRHRAGMERKDRELERAYEQSRQRQRLLDGVMETVSVGVWVLDAHGEAILTNGPGRQALAQAATTNQGPGPSKPTNCPENTGTKSPLNRAISGEEFSDELFWAGSGEARKAYSTTARALHNDDGNRAGSVVAFTDVTSLIQAMSVKDKFVATISHELRTPLTSILGYLELMLDDLDPARAPGQLAVIERNARRLLALINDLLLVASDGRDLNIQPTHFANILEHAVKAATSAASAKGLQIRTDIDGPLPARLDPDQILQVVGNLLSNAIKFSPDGSGEITLTARCNGAGLVCAVTDHGIGMNEHERNEAFSKFFRADHAMNTAVPGAGLGLPISKAIIERHGGSISLTSAPGAGTTATFTIPTVTTTIE
jgi:signal transduction histidine kinase